VASALGFDTALSQEPALAVIIPPSTQLLSWSPASMWRRPVRPGIDHTDQRRFADLEAVCPGERELLLMAEEGSAVAGAAMGFRSSGSEVTLRLLAVANYLLRGNSPDTTRGGRPCSVLLLQQLARHDNALDLVRPLIDLGDVRVPDR
jgi:hypothetical protein